MRAQTAVSRFKDLSKERPQRDIGTLLIEAGRLKPEDADKVLRLHAEKGMRFGEAAIALGLVSEAHVNEALAHQFEYRYLMPGQSAISREVIAAYEPFTTEVDELRALRAQLIQRHFGKTDSKRRLAIVGCDAGGGRSYVAANLAVVFSQLGQRTLLVDADLRDPRQHELFGVSNSAGLSTVLASRCDLTVVQRVSGLLDLSLLTAGPIPPNPAELLERDTFADLTEQMSANYDVVLFDTAAMDRCIDASPVAARAGAAIIVLRRYRARAKAVQALMSALGGVEILGTVLNSR